MEGLVQKSFSINLKVLTILGFYPPQKWKKVYKIYASTVYCFFTILIPTLASVHLLLKEDLDLAQVSDNAFIICETGCFIIKLLPFVSKPDQVRKSIYMLECPLFSIYTDKQEKIINECVEICKRNCRLFLCGCSLTCITWASAPFFVGGYRRLPLEVWLPFDKESGLSLYLISFVYVLAGVGNAAVCSGALDPLLAGLILQATGQLRVLKNNLQFLDEYADEEILNLNPSISEKDKMLLKTKIISNKIRLCINHHIAIEEFVNFYEETYSSAVFIQFAASVVVICISCLRLIMVEPFTFKFFAMILFLFTMLTEVFLYSYYGTILFEESNTLADAIFMGKWYDYDITNRRALIVLMERSKRPMIITAGKLLDLSLETFTTILRRSYSLLAVLKNFK